MDTGGKRGNNCAGSKLQVQTYVHNVGKVRYLRRFKKIFIIVMEMATGKKNTDKSAVEMGIFSVRRKMSLFRGGLTDPQRPTQLHDYVTVTNELPDRFETDAKGALGGRSASPAGPSLGGSPTVVTP